MTLLAILNTSEKRQFELPPKFNSDERSVNFYLPPPLKRLVSRMANDACRAGFLLQLAYFRANARFYPTAKYRKRDIRYVASLLQCKDLNLERYNSTISSKHRKKILAVLKWTENDPSTVTVMENFAIRQAQNQVQPRQVFVGLVDLCWKHRFVIPSYTDICEMITNGYNQHESVLLEQLDSGLDSDQINHLELLIGQGDKSGSRFMPFITDLKKINQGLRPSDIKENIETTLVLQDYYFQFEEVIQSLSLSDQGTQYYATWFSKADYQQLTQFTNRNKLYLHLLAYIKHQYYTLQDTLVDILLKSVSSCLSSTKSKLADLDQGKKKERDKALQILNQSHKSYSAFAKAVIGVVESKGATANEKYQKIEVLVRDLEGLTEEDESTLETLDEHITRQSRNQNYYELLEAQSNKLQRRVSGIVKALEFDKASSNTPLITAIEYYRDNDGTISNNSPIDFLDSSELKILYRDDKIITALYKCLLFFQIASAIKSGDLNLLHSYRYRSIQDYLIDSDTWKNNKERILQETGLTRFSDGESYMDEMAQLLDDKYHSVNTRIIDNKNPHFKVNHLNKPVITTPGKELENKEFIADTLSKNGFVSILQVLREVNTAANFSKCMTHFSNKNTKMKPTEETLFAGVIGKGCNIGIPKMASISAGVKEHVLHNTVTWCFDRKNLQEANRLVVDCVHNLGLANNYVDKPSFIHSSSDGRKVNVAVDSLHANYSFKYFGKDKGVTMYTFIDERQALFYSTVFSSSDREAAYVIDGLLNNDVSHNRIHSTDTHGFTEQIFAATHFIDVDFAPRFKGLSNQRIYGFSAKRTYQKKGYPILPSRTIDRKLILKHWDDILRFMATIKSNHTTASQLFKRLSSYAKTHPLYKALKEFGRIIKSKYILTYYDDLKLRQQIQKQLNRVELSNKFAHAVFFDNDQAFQEGEPDEQALAMSCQTLIQNSIILWNYMYLSDQIINAKDKETRASLIESISQGSVITWRHVNLIFLQIFIIKKVLQPTVLFLYICLINRLCSTSIYVISFLNHSNRWPQYEYVQNSLSVQAEPSWNQASPC